MTQRLEAFIGLCVIIGAGFFLVTLMKFSSQDFGKNFYLISARFSDVTGISTGTEIRMAGVKIGTVQSTSLNPNDYQANVAMNINQEVKLPVDSSVKIASDGLLGGSYISIDAGTDTAYIKPGQELQLTQSSVSLIDLLSRAVFSSSGGKSE